MYIDLKKLTISVYQLFVGLSVLGAVVTHAAYQFKSENLNDVRVDRSKKFGLVVGAGPTGLVSALALNKEGWDVIVLEKRKQATRSNLVFLKKEIKASFTSLGILEDFEKVAAKLDFHYDFYRKSGEVRKLDINDMTQKVELDSLRFEPENMGEFFNDDGRYSVPIEDLQEFLARKSEDRGIHIVTNVQAELVDMGHDMYQAVVSDLSNKSIRRVFGPDLVVLADGASGTVGTNKVIERKHPTESENWIFGTVKYPEEWLPGSNDASGAGVSLLDYDTDNHLQLLTVATFNPKARLVNVMVSLNDCELGKEQIALKIVDAANAVFRQAEDQVGLPGRPLTTLIEKPVTASEKVVSIRNRQAQNVTLGQNVVFVGDRAAVSSPLAGQGASLGMTCYPYGIEELAKRILDHGHATQEDFAKFEKQAKACGEKWFARAGTVSDYIKTLVE